MAKCKRLTVRLDDELDAIIDQACVDSACDKASGTANLKLLGLTISVPFQSTKQISITDEIKKHFSSGYAPQPVTNGDSTFDEPMPQYYATALSIHVSKTNVEHGSFVSITGRLTTNDGQSLQNAAISIKDADFGSGDDFIAMVYTDANGYYSYTWSARTMDPLDHGVEIYSVYDGALDAAGSRSDQIKVSVT